MGFLRPFAIAVAVLSLAGACVTVGPSHDSEDAWTGKADGEGTPPLAVGEIASAAGFDQLSFGEGVVVLGKSVKFLIDYRNPSDPRIYFMNSSFRNDDGTTPQSARYHYYFARAILKGFKESIATFNQRTYSGQLDRRYFAGTIQEYNLGDHAARLYGIQLYPEDTASEDTILTAVKIVLGAFTIPDARMALVATGPQQTTATIGTPLADLGVSNQTIDRILGAVNYLPMNLGEAWGVLRMFPSLDRHLTATDIPVFDNLPLDLSVVAGVITRSFQDSSSHVNLKSKERKTADMVLRDAGPDNERLAPWIDKPIHLIVSATGFEIAASSDEEVAAKLRERTDRPWTSLPTEPETRILSYAAMCPDAPADCLALGHRYGSKAANLGFLTNQQVLGTVDGESSASKAQGYDLVPAGVGVPLEAYNDFVSYAPNQELRDALDLLISQETAGVLDPDARFAAVQYVQELFYAAAMPPESVQAIREALAAALPGVKKIKVRSSANAEDLANFDGAGLYSSFSANLSKADNPDGSCQLVREEEDVETKEKMDPKTLACAMKGVYASLWNPRAVEERSFARLKHASATMGLAIVPKYDSDSDIVANSVVVTRVINANGVYGYLLASQQGNNLVTNPIPGTLAESVIAAFSDPDVPPSFVVTRYAQVDVDSAPLTQTVMTNAQMQTLTDITRLVERAYCEANPDYHGGDCDYVAFDIDKPTALDLEFKLLANGHFVAKQVREFAGR